MRLPLVAGVLLALVALPGAAHAQAAPFEDPYEAPRVARPPTLPELTHAEIEGTVDTTEGAIIPPPGGVWTHAYVERLDVEVPLALRRWYVGASYEAAAGGTGGAFHAVGGNLALDGRSLWATRSGLGFGGGLQLVLPTASFDPGSDTGRLAVDAVTVRPWDVLFFTPGILGLRPYVDVRVIRAPFIAQLREGLDLAQSTSLLGDRRLFAMTGVYLGWEATRAAAFGLEAFEEYALDVPGIRDGARAGVVLSPNARFTLPWVQPAVSFFTSLGTPLYGANDHVWGFRLAFTVVYDASAKLKVRTK